MWLRLLCVGLMFTPAGRCGSLRASPVRCSRCRCSRPPCAAARRSRPAARATLSSASAPIASTTESAALRWVAPPASCHSTSFAVIASTLAWRCSVPCRSTASSTRQRRTIGSSRPGLSLSSSTVTARPRASRNSASSSPTRPPPTITTRAPIGIHSFDRLCTALALSVTPMHAAGLEHGAFGQAELGFGDGVGAVAGHQAAQFVAAPDVLLAGAVDGRRRPPRAAGHHDDIRLQARHQFGRGRRRQADLDRRLLDLLDQVVEQAAVFRIGQAGEEQRAAHAGRCARPG